VLHGNLKTIAPLREEPAPSEDRHRSCACAYERAASFERKAKPRSEITKEDPRREAVRLFV